MPQVRPMRAGHNHLLSTKEPPFSVELDLLDDAGIQFRNRKKGIMNERMDTVPPGREDSALRS